MTEIEAAKILKEKGLAWGAVDAAYQPARWMIDAVVAAVATERQACADLCMKVTPDRTKLGAIGEAAHYAACAEAIKARSIPAQPD